MTYKHIRGIKPLFLRVFTRFYEKFARFTRLYEHLQAFLSINSVSEVFTMFQLVWVSSDGTDKCLWASYNSLDLA